MVAFVFFKCFRSKRYEPSFKWILAIFFCVVSNILVKTSQEMNNSINSTTFHAETDDFSYSTMVYSNKTTIKVFLQSGPASHSYLKKYEVSIDLDSGMSSETSLETSNLIEDVTTETESSGTPSDTYSFPTDVTETTSEESSETTSESSYFPTAITETTSEESSETTSEASSLPTVITETTSEESSQTPSEASSLPTVITETTSEESSSSTNDMTDSNSTDSDITTTYTPTDVPPSNFFNVTDAVTGVVCILAELSVALNVSYETSSGESSVVSIFIPASARSGGNCSGNRPYLSVLWEPSTSGGRALRDLDSNQLNLYMAQDTSTYFVDAIDLNLMMDAFPEAVDPVLSTNATNLRLFETSKQRSFTCSREEVVPMGQVELVVVNVRLQAFNNDSTVTDFHLAEDCDNPSGSTLPGSAGLGVGAIVGISLAVALLLFLVSTAYFLRRSRRTGSFNPIMSDV